MATGASNSDLAVILADARKGILTQTRRHAYIASRLGIRHAVLAVNKIDLAGFSEETFARIEADFRAFAAKLDFETLCAIPISARYGDNVIAPSPRMPWYKGKSLLATLEDAETESDIAHAPPRPRFQGVLRHDRKRPYSARK
jgi:bifunctional enzyme CysN/CysC